MDDHTYELLIHRLERDAYQTPSVFRAKVALFCGIAHLALAFAALLTVAIVWLMFDIMRDGGDALSAIGLALAAPALVAAVALARVLASPLRPPKGSEITHHKAPRLFEMLERLRDKADGRAVDHVLVTDTFDIAISQVPRRGMFGGHTVFLCIGLPCLFALPTRELAAALAREYDHVAGGNARLGAWVYRQRQTFIALTEQIDKAGEHPAGKLIRAGLRHIAPYFKAYTFVIARQQEYEADALASVVTSSDANVRCMCREELIGRWLSDTFWPHLYAQAGKHAQPPFAPYGAMRTAFAANNQDWNSPKQLARVLKRKSGYAHPRPSLHDRLSALGQRPALPPQADRAAADTLLGQFSNDLAIELDKTWWKKERAGWEAHHQQQGRYRKTITTLAARPMDSLTPLELQDLGSALAGCGHAEEAREVFTRLFASSESPYPRARMRYGQILLDMGEEAGMEELVQAANEDPHLVRQCARRGYRYLRRTKGKAAADYWVESLESAAA